MAEDFDEHTNPEDAAMADIKGILRERARTKKMSWDEIAAASNVTYVTVKNVMIENNVRHTLRTLHRIAKALDVDIGVITRIGTSGKARVIPPLTPNQKAAVLAYWREVELNRKIKKS